MHKHQVKKAAGQEIEDEGLTECHERCTLPKVAASLHSQVQLSKQSLQTPLAHRPAPIMRYEHVTTQIT